MGPKGCGCGVRGRAVPGAHLALRLRLGPAGAVGRCGLSAGAARCCPGPRGHCTTSISLPSPDLSARPPSHPSSCFGGRREMVLQGAGSGAAAPCAALVAPAPARGQPWAPCCSPVRAAPSWLPACHPARSSRGWAGAAGAGSGPVCPNPAPPLRRGTPRELLSRAAPAPSPTAAAPLLPRWHVCFPKPWV